MNKCLAKLKADFFLRRLLLPPILILINRVNMSILKTQLLAQGPIYRSQKLQEQKQAKQLLVLEIAKDLKQVQ